MNRWKLIGALAAAVALIASGVYASPAPQDAGEDAYVRHDRRDWEDEARKALAIGLGLISLDEPGIGDDVEIYGTISFRFAIGPDTHRPGSWRGYLEPELGYWESSEAGPVPTVNAERPEAFRQTGKSDLLLGINIVGVQPFHSVDFFIGAGVGIHFIDVDRDRYIFASGQRRFDQRVSVSDEALGVNAQFGVDVGISRRTSFFGVGRFDIVDDGSNALDAKVYLGLRFRFGGKRPDAWDPDE